MAVASAGCGGSGKGAAGDTTRPTVISTVPANAATSAATSGAVAATFSEAMAPLTVTTSTFSLTGPGGAAVAGWVALDASNKVATFQAIAPLAANTKYLAKLKGGNGGVADQTGNEMATDYSWVFITGAAADTTRPAVTFTTPASGATSVAINSAIIATFSKPMAPATLTGATFTLTGPGAAAVAGTVTYTGLTATFQPGSVLATGTPFTATLTTGAKDLAGNALASNYVWSFTTGATADTLAPTVVSTSPPPSATGVLLTAVIQATFSEPVAPGSLGNATFTLTGPGGAAVPGTVVFDAPNNVANFKAAALLAGNTNYQATLKGGPGGVTDLAGNALANDFSWVFTTGTHVGLSPVFLGSAANYAILAKSAISTVPTSAVIGDVALSPAAASFITGFGLTAATGYATSPQVTGKIFAADYAPPTPSNLTTAVGDMQAAYTDAAGRPTPDFLELKSGAIGGLNLTPGLYKWAGTVTIPSDVTLTGTATDVWIFQISGDLTMSSATNVFLAGGAKAKNVFWQVAGAVDVGTNAHFEGIILSQTAIALRTAASMNGRALAQTAVTLDAVKLTQPAP